MADPRAGYDGLANLAHAVRRSAALYVAMSISPEGTTEAELFATADRMAAWIRGQSGAPPQQDEGFLGMNPWQAD